MSVAASLHLPSKEKMSQPTSTAYDTRYPSIADLKRRAKRRLPNFAFDYVDGAIDDEDAKRRNRQAFRDVHLTPRYLRDVSTVDTRNTLFGAEYALPFGISPVGLGNMMWPGAELALARAAQAARIPFVLSTFSTTDLDVIAKEASDVCWFQLYVPRNEDVMEDLIARVKRASFHALVVTVDIPVGAKRNRELKNGLKLPFTLTPQMIWQCLTHPTWALTTLAHGAPDFVNVARYRTDANQGLSDFVSSMTIPGLPLERLRRIRVLWDGPLIVKGLQAEENVRQAIDCGADGIIISNHGGRQLDAAPATIDTLRSLPGDLADKTTVMIDGGIRTGLDVLRAKALGAQATFSGRTFYYGIGALGPAGARQVIEILRDEVTRTLQQLGCIRFADLDSGWLSHSGG
ncbi:MAG: alpha-hydroxy acid oxidase [Methyloceanibacter sp.]|nr:alpha-hydroxy acid oxidase [Methyloceanibacter sp.]